VRAGRELQHLHVMSKPSAFLDAGHGGKDFGAVGAGGTREKDVALAVVLLTGSILIGAGVDVFYSRKDDRFLELSERAKMANSLGVDRFLSVHCNSAKVPAEGFEVFTTPGQTRADAFATELFKSFGVEFPTQPKRVDTTDGDPDKEANFAVLRLSSMPAALFELGFIHTPGGEAFLKNPVNQARFAKALAAGVLSDLGLASATAPHGPLPSPADLRSEVARIAQELFALANA
jgi:N-acetylmuramoyl-L-alanine amidase